MKAIISTLLFAGLCAFLAATPASAAAVGETCAGIGNLQCDAGLACQFPLGQCNTADLAGKCVEVPETCPKQGPPFCGCDGTTYDNECALLKAGVRPDRRGNCGNKDKGKDAPPASAATAGNAC